jgi:hypothetical protein
MLVCQPAGWDQHCGIDHGVGIEHPQRSAAVVCRKPALKALKAANSMVPSMETRSTAMLATQNTGHGEAVLGRKLGKSCSMVAGEDLMVW